MLRPPKKEKNMTKKFELKKYKFKEAVGPYKAGAIVVFKDVDAKAFEKYIVPVDDVKEKTIHKTDKK